MKKKTIIIIVISVIIFWLFVLTICIVRLYNGPSRADEVFEQDYAELVEVVEYLNSLEDVENVDIDSTDGTMLVHYTDGRIVKDVEITDKDVLLTISALMQKGYFDISMSEDTVYFDRWRNPFGRFVGFAFSTDGTGELDIEFLIGQRELSEKDWYFYVSDYNEWRSLNSN